MQEKLNPHPQRLAAGIVRETKPRLVRGRPTLKKYVQKAGDWKNWYENNYDFLAVIFGDHVDELKKFLKILAATSQGSTVAANVALAIDAFEKMVLEGKTLPEHFKGLEGVRRNLSKIATGGEVEGPKVGPYSQALAGDVGAVAVDRHIFEILFGGTASTKIRTETAIGIIAEIAEELNLDNRQVQAALWAANQIRKKATPGNYIDTIKKKQQELQKIVDELSRRQEG
jgi:hypothetical protein